MALESCIECKQPIDADERVVVKLKVGEVNVCIPCYLVELW